MWSAPSYSDDRFVISEKKLDVILTDEQFESAILHMWDCDKDGIFYKELQGFFDREEYEYIPKVLKIIEEKRNTKINITFKDKK